MTGDDVDSILARGGTLRETPALSYRLGSVLAPVGLAVGAAAVGQWPRPVGLALIGAVVLLGVLVLVLHSRSFVAVVGPTLRWRLWGRTHEVSLARVDLPVRLGGSFDDRLLVVVEGRRRATLYGRVWGPQALNGVEQRLRYNIRVARPAAVAAMRSRPVS
jgi:hypothetical protein